MRIRNSALALAAIAAAASSAVAAPIALAPMTSFGNGNVGAANDGWRAPNEIVVGDLAGTATGSNYNYLAVGSLERGLAYNPATGNLILVSRSASGNGIRVLNGTTGADVGALNQGSGIITGGTFVTSAVGVGDDGQIYVANLQTNASTGAFKVYQWTDESAAAPNTYFNSTLAGFTGTPRLGDSLDVTGSGASTRVVAGASGSIGYAVIDGSGGTAVGSFAPAGPAAGDFRLGVTFAGSASEVWGKQTGGTAAAAPLRRTSFSGAAGTTDGFSILTAGGEAAMDYAVVGGIPYLAVLNMNTNGGTALSTVQMYNMTDPANPILETSASTINLAGISPFATLASNGNATGSVKFGQINPDGTGTLYAMSTNQGIQAFTFAIPEPGSIGLLALGAIGLLRRIRA